MAPDPRPIEPNPDEPREAGAADPRASGRPAVDRPEPEGRPLGSPAPEEVTSSSPDDGAGIRLDDPDLVVAMRGVSRRFEDREVLRGIDLTVPRGTILGIIGPSGAGKTTTIRMMTGALAPTTGEVAVLGRNPKRFRRRERERIGYMPQSFALYEDLTAGENIDFVASLFGMLWRKRRRRVREVLKLVDLWDARGRQAGRLSGGMQRRLELACALVHEPELIILDEPTAGIDPLLRGSIWEELHRLRDAGRTLLVTTQHVSEADECDAVAMIVGGEIIALAAPDELRRIATNGDILDIETTAVFDGSDLIGTPGVGEVTQDGPRHLRVVVDDAGAALPIVVNKIKAAGVEVASAREHRLSFDEIFAILVARHERSGRAAGAAAGDEQRADAA
ncbi:MAG TPA: ABC transporter ATP-binding protein [Candidatus Limnocylindrales bacterium]|nr:ABC transporter ATP-binding protein [Candidatus Limnocylindrales bacterium]